MIYPSFPDANKHELIGICAPSAGVGHKLESFDLSLDTFNEIGFRTEQTESVRIDAIRPSSGEQRGLEFNTLIASDDVKMIISASGGEYCIEMLPYIDIDLVRSNPKWIVGASDPTNILYFITTKLDIATIYGVNAGTFDWRPLHEFQENAMSILQGNIVIQNSFDLFDDSREFGAMSADAFNTPVKWELYNVDDGILDNFDITGRIIGGCSDIIFNLIGTPYDGTTDFLKRYSEEGIIWYFDPFETTPNQLHLNLLKMKHAGYFHNTMAVVFGRIMFPGDFPKEDYIKLISMDLECPFIWDADIGHVKPCMTIINGSIAHVTCREGHGSIKMELK